MNTYSSFAPDVRIGDIVSVEKGLFTHVGVVVPGGVFHNSPGSYEQIVSWAEFSQGRQMTLTPTHMEAWLVMHRVEKILTAPRVYDAVNQNCEHTVNEVVYGEKKSPQLGGMIAAGALVTLVLFGALSK